MSHGVAVYLRHFHVHDAADDVRADIRAGASDDLVDGAQDPVEAVLVVILDALEFPFERRRFVDGHRFTYPRLVDEDRHTGEMLKCRMQRWNNL